MKVLSVVAAVIVASSVVPAEYEPPRRLSGDVPNPPVKSIGWVEAVVDLELDASGAITNATGLRATPGGLDFVLPALKSWKFRPANDGKDSVGSHVLVAAMMRPAQLFDPAGGSPAADLAKPNDGAPYPKNTSRPAYPIKAVGNRSVLVEVIIRDDGRVERATVVGPTSGFDNAALTAARAWTFRAPNFKDKPVGGVAYLIFGFRMPV